MGKDIIIVYNPRYIKPICYKSYFIVSNYGMLTFNIKGVDHMAIISEGKYVTDNCMQTLIQLVKNQFSASLNNTIITCISDSDENDSTTIEAIIKAWDDARGYTYEEE